jgi:hypothetical protein
MGGCRRNSSHCVPDRIAFQTLEQRGEKGCRDWLISRAFTLSGKAAAGIPEGEKHDANTRCRLVRRLATAHWYSPVRRQFIERHGFMRIKTESVGNFAYAESPTASGIL